MTLLNFSSSNMTSEDIPKTGKAGVVVNEGPDFRVEVQDIPVPEPGPDDVLLKLNVTGLCMSDVHFMLHDWAVPPMSQFQKHPCAGHEGAGVVVKVGTNVTNWQVGDRGGLKPIYQVCHECEQCLEGRDNYCSKAVYTGLPVRGSYSQYVVSPANYTTRIPDGVPDHVAGPVMCSYSTMYRAIKDCNLKPGSWIAFAGAGGGVGSAGLSLAKAMGFRSIAIDGGEEKGKHCLDLGAESFVDFTQHKDVAARVKEIADGIGPHAVIVTAYQAYKDAVSYAGERVSSKIVAIALPPANTVTLGADPNILAFKNLHIMGSVVGNYDDAEQVLDMARKGQIASIAEVRGLSRFNESVQALRSGKVKGRIVIDFNQE